MGDEELGDWRGVIFGRWIWMDLELPSIVFGLKGHRDGSLPDPGGPRKATKSYSQADVSQIFFLVNVPCSESA